MALFNVTYDIVTPESAEHGDLAESGFIIERAGLRQAVDSVNGTRTCHVDGVESYVLLDNCLIVYNLAEYLTGANESRALHFPTGLTESSKRRIYRLVLGESA